MKALHVFADKKEKTLSLAWLDENFQQALDQIEGLNTRITVLGNLVAERGEAILKLQDQVKKLQPKAKK